MGVNKFRQCNAMAQSLPRIESCKPKASLPILINLPIDLMHDCTVHSAHGFSLQFKSFSVKCRLSRFLCQNAVCPEPNDMSANSALCSEQPNTAEGWQNQLVGTTWCNNLATHPRSCKLISESRKGKEGGGESMGRKGEGRGWGKAVSISFWLLEKDIGLPFDVCMSFIPLLGRFPPSTGDTYHRGRGEEGGKGNVGQGLKSKLYICICKLKDLIRLRNRVNWIKFYYHWTKLKTFHFPIINIHLYGSLRFT